MAGTVTLQHGWTRLPVLLALLVAALVAAPAAQAISAPIHIHGTGTDGVLIRPTPDTSRPALGWMAEGTSPDYHCFTYGQTIGNVNVWFLVTSRGITGYYASYWDDSSYHSEAELTSKYGIPKCGATPPPPPPTQPPTTPPPPPPKAPTYSAIYYSPFNPTDNDAWARAHDPTVATIYGALWWGYPVESIRCARAASTHEALRLARQKGGGHVTNLAGWSLGRLGPIFFLKDASAAERKAVTYVVLIDPGTKDELTCDRSVHAGSVLASWLQHSPNAHLIVISGDVSRHDASPDGHGSRGIQESYFNAIRATHDQSVRNRVLTCNYAIDHFHAFFAGEWWIAHHINTDKPCPTLRDKSGRYSPRASWHP